MRRFPVLAAMLVIGLAASSCVARANTGGQPASPGGGLSTDLGRRDFARYCAACHGISGTGNGAIAEFLTIPATDLTQLSRLNAGKFPRQRLREVIDSRVQVRVHGERDMPVWGDWFDREAMEPDTDHDTREMIVRDRIESLLDYIETLQGN